MRYLLFLSVLSVFIIAQSANAQLVWEIEFEDVNSLSSPRAIDLDGDGIKDVVMGGGLEEDSSQTGFLAVDGETGDLLWSAPSLEQVFSSAAFLNINSDQYPDVVLGGRLAQLQAFDGLTGDNIWQFYTDTIAPDSVGLFNFYTPQVIPDQNFDGVSDLLTANGGDRSAMPQDTVRPFGHIMIVSGADGSELAKMTVPDSMETYCSPLINNLGTNEPWVIYGTGGETIRGSIWKSKLADVLAENNTTAIQIHSNDSNGYVGPPSLVDLTGDGIVDVVFNNFAGQVGAINGATNQPIWIREFVNGESNLNPTIGHFNEDESPDVATVVAFGEWFIYSDFVRMIFDGATGETIDSITLETWNLASMLAADLNEDGKDEIISARTNSVFNSQLGEDVFRTTVLAEDVISGDTIFQFGPHAGANPFYTPLVSDLDDDGLVDIVYVFMEDSLSVFSNSKLSIRRIETNLSISEDVAWGSYIGTQFDGTYHPPTTVSLEEDFETGAFNSEFETVGIYDLTGRQVSNNEEDLPNGIYLIESSDGKTTRFEKTRVFDGELR